MSANISPYLTGNFAPVLNEHKYQCKEIIGTIPADLNGFFLRNGPNNQFTSIDESLYHWFDGDGMIHSLEFSKGQAHYQNKWIHTQGFQIEKQANKAIWKGFLSPLDFSNEHGLLTKNLANTALIAHGNRLMALWEAGKPHELSLPDLQTLGEVDFNGDWPHPVTAHPKICPKTGELLTFCYNQVGEFDVTYGVVSPKGKVTHKTGIKLLGEPVMIHDFAITERYTLILDMPVVFNMDRALKGELAYQWEPQNGSRIGVLPRNGNGNDIRWFTVKTGNIIHVFNAWEHGDEVILEACRSEKMNISFQREEDESIEDEQAVAYQYRLNLSTGEVIEKAINSLAIEFPTFNRRYTGKKHRYCYASTFTAGTELPLFDGLVKFDRQQSTNETYTFKPGIYGGEFIFIPRGKQAEEDSGYLVGYIHNNADNQSECWIIDAQNFTSGPIARIIMPTRIPYGFHGYWVDHNAAICPTINDDFNARLDYNNSDQRANKPVCMISTPTERDTQRLQYLKASPWAEWDMQALSSDASFRRYFRLSNGDESVLLDGRPTLIRGSCCLH